MISLSDAVKWVSLQGEGSVKDTSYKKIEDFFLIVKKPARLAFYYRDGFLVKAQSFDEAIKPFDGSEQLVEEDPLGIDSADINYIDDMLKDTEFRSDLSQKIADRLIEGFKSSLIETNPRANLAYVSEDQAEGYYKNNVDEAIKEELAVSPFSLSNKAEEFAKKNKFSIWIAYKNEFNSQRQTLLSSIENKRNKKSKSKDSKSVFVNPV